MTTQRRDISRPPDTTFGTDRHLTATRVANEVCANVMRGVRGVAYKKSAHWSVSHSLISHHRTATIKQSTGFVGSLWSAFVRCAESVQNTLYFIH